MLHVSIVLRYEEESERCSGKSTSREHYYYFYHVCLYGHTYSKGKDQPGSAVPSRVSLLISILRLNLYSNSMKTEQQMPTRQARTRTIKTK